MRRPGLRANIIFRLVSASSDPIVAVLASSLSSHDFQKGPVPDRPLFELLIFASVAIGLMWDEGKKSASEAASMFADPMVWQGWLAWLGLLGSLKRTDPVRSKHACHGFLALLAIDLPSDVGLVPSVCEEGKMIACFVPRRRSTLPSCGFPERNPERLCWDVLKLLQTALVNGSPKNFRCWWTPSFQVFLSYIYTGNFGLSRRLLRASIGDPFPSGSTSTLHVHFADQPHTYDGCDCKPPASVTAVNDSVTSRAAIQWRKRTGSR